jgi:cation:H+ antiporter
MLVDILAMVAGLVLLVTGGDRVVESASIIARRIGFSTFFVGGTLVAVGSSLPELATVVYAAVYGAGDLAIGHVVGSATSQITLGIGAVALLVPLSVERSKVRTYGGGMVVAMLAMLAVAWSGSISHLEGAAMVAAYAVFLAVRADHTDFDDALAPSLEDGPTRRRATLWILAGLALLVVGGHLLVTGAEGVAASLGLPSYLLGLITGLGTTAPEIAVAALAVHHDRGGIAVGTLFGSNITDPLFSLGAGALVAGVHLDHRRAALVPAVYMLAVSAAVVLWFHQREGLGRRGAVGCCLLYVPAYLL